MPDAPTPPWILTCSCGWTRQFSQRWATESAAKLHPKLGAPGIAHIVRMEPPQAGSSGEPHLTLA